MCPTDHVVVAKEPRIPDTRNTLLPDQILGFSSSRRSFHIRLKLTMIASSSRGIAIMPNKLAIAGPTNPVERERASFICLPTELQLEILRHFLVATPPRINRSGQIKHVLIDNQLTFIRNLVLDVLFHTTAIKISSTSLRSDSGLPDFLSIHDQIHGQQKRRLIRLKVRGDRAMSLAHTGLYHLLRLVDIWQDWAYELGLPWECVDFELVLRMLLRFRGSCSRRLEGSISSFLKSLDRLILAEDRRKVAAVKLRCGLLELAGRRGAHTCTISCPDCITREYQRIFKARWN